MPKKSKWKHHKSTYTIESVNEFPLTGAIIHFKQNCCGMRGGQPFFGDPKDNQHLVGKKVKSSCICKKKD